MVLAKLFENFGDNILKKVGGVVNDSTVELKHDTK
jgi:hypothetical protein